MLGMPNNVMNKIKGVKMSDYVKVLMDKEDALELLIDRVRFWKKDDREVDLYAKMYEEYLESGVFGGREFNVMSIVDNDVVNYCEIVSKGDDDFKKLLKAYQERGLGDVSDIDFDYYKISYIEAVDDEEKPEMFLIRC